MCRDVEDSNSRKFLVIFCTRHWRLGWWHFMLLTFLSHYFSCDCQLLALYSEGGERTTALAVGRGCSSQHKKCQKGSRHMPEPWPTLALNMTNTNTKPTHTQTIHLYKV
uniref:Macaca fascicularis brain cDNA, clone: QflA-17521 n=1 Tax=Macaca fascicularis TaxID=9541 RepID=I7GBU9_MACFA|nr:unnamed protein product [Macaca fascicularis]